MSERKGRREHPSEGGAFGINDSSCHNLANGASVHLSVACVAPPGSSYFAKDTDGEYYKRIWSGVHVDESLLTLGHGAKSLYV